MQMLTLKLIKRNCSVLLISLIAISCGQPSGNEKVKLFVAAGLAESVDSLTKIYSEKNNVGFEINAASSGTLAKQIEQGAPSAIYFSANIKWMDYLVEKNMLCDSCHKIFAGNQLVVVTSKSDTTDKINFRGLPKLLKGNKKLALGKPEHVPAGKYAKEALESLGIFDSLQSSMIFTKDVRAALILAEMGEAEFAIVYKTDAISSKKAKIVTTVEDSLHSKIDLSIGLIDTNNSKAKEFYEFVNSKEAKEVLGHFGFENRLHNIN